MGERRSLVSGDVIAQRYQLQDLVTERLGSTTWRAHDAVLSRNVGLELLPSDDPRATGFLEAARRSTVVTDPRFLRVLDLIEDDRGHHLVVREWARAFSLDAVLAQAPLPSWRAAAVVAEVAEALASAHSLGQYHRRLTPHQILLKESGAVRVVGLGVATALAPVGAPDDELERQHLERLDVQGLGRVLYACLTSRWPGGHVDGLRAAPTEHGRLLRPSQVRAGVGREVDVVCDRILGRPPQQHRPPLTTAADIGVALRRIPTPHEPHEPAAPLDLASSPDLMRHDPVVEPQGPPPGLEPPRRRPKAHEPAPPTRVERSLTRARGLAQGDRGLVVLGIVSILLICSILLFLVDRTTSGPTDPPTEPVATGAPEQLELARVSDFDPQSDDGRESPTRVDLATDGDPDTGWTTATYFQRADLGGLKDGVGLLVELADEQEVRSVSVRFRGAPTSVEVYAAPAGVTSAPTALDQLDRVGGRNKAPANVTVELDPAPTTRYVLVWLTELPQVSGGFRGEIREITVRS